MMRHVHAAVNYALKMRDAEKVREQKRRERLAAQAREPKSTRGTGRVPASQRGLAPSYETVKEATLGTMVTAEGKTVRANRAQRRAMGQRGGRR